MSAGSKIEAFIGAVRGGELHKKVFFYIALKRNDPEAFDSFLEVVKAVLNTLKAAHPSAQLGDPEVRYVVDL